MFHVGLSSVFQTTIHFRLLQRLVKKFATTKFVSDLPRVDAAVDSETIANDKAC